VHIEWADADLWIKIWSNRQRLGWSGRNIPSFEIFTSPDYRDVQGWMKFNQKIYRYGQVIDGISCWTRNSLFNRQWWCTHGSE
jgi:aminopeptidase